MALSNTTVNGTSIPGMLGSITNGQFTPTTPTSVGQQAVSPTTAVKSPTNTLPTKQIAPTDLSGTYANVGGTIYNKKSQTSFSNATDFFKDSGQSSFNNLKFDTAYTPTGKETIYGQSAPAPAPVPAPASSTSTPVSSNSAPAPLPSSGPYTPPNQGTTGVSQGGIIGNLIGQSQTQNPNYTAALAKLNEVAAKQKALQDEAAKENADISSRPEGLTQQTGQQGILAQLLASRQAALAPEYNAAATALGAANTQTSNINQALSSAGGLNSPITGVPYGTQTISPSQPASGTPFGTATTSGALNLNSLIGQRPSSSNAGVTEFYNTQTGQGFSNPQALADFVNKQMPGANATAQNVFDLLKTQGQGTQNGGALNPLNNISSLASQVLAGTLSYGDALSYGGSVQNFAGALNQEIMRQNPNADIIALQSQASGKGGTLANIPAWTAADSAAKGIQSQIVGYLNQHPEINPDTLNLANLGRQWLAGNFSNTAYQTLGNYLNEFTSTLAPVLGVGGDTTNFKTQIAQSFIDASASGKSISQVLANIMALADQKIASYQAGANTALNVNSSSTNSNFGW